MDRSGFSPLRLLSTIRDMSCVCVLFTELWVVVFESDLLIRAVRRCLAGLRVCY